MIGVETYFVIFLLVRLNRTILYNIYEMRTIAGVIFTFRRSPRNNGHFLICSATSLRDNDVTPTVATHCNNRSAMIWTNKVRGVTPKRKHRVHVRRDRFRLHVADRPVTCLLFNVPTIKSVDRDSVQHDPVCKSSSSPLRTPTAEARC